MSLEGRVCLVTGATSGHGRALARQLALAGADVVLLGRNREKCSAVQDEIGEACGGKAPSLLLCDLSSRLEIDRAASEFVASGRPLHVLVNNAGLVNLKRSETSDGSETTFAVNYLALFQLTLRLLPRLRESEPARVVNISSDTHRIVRLDLEDLQLLRTRYSFMRAYGRSKLAGVYFTLELARRLAGTGVTVNAVDPGPVGSNIGANNPGVASFLVSPLIRWLFPTPERSARTAFHLATAPELEGDSGGYYKSMTRRAPRVKSADSELGARLWRESARLTGVDFRVEG